LRVKGLGLRVSICIRSVDVPHIRAWANSQLKNNNFTEMCSDSKAGSYSRLIDFANHSILGLSNQEEEEGTRTTQHSSRHRGISLTGIATGVSVETFYAGELNVILRPASFYHFSLKSATVEGNTHGFFTLILLSIRKKCTRFHLTQCINWFQKVNPPTKTVSESQPPHKNVNLFS